MVRSHPADTLPRPGCRRAQLGASALAATLVLVLAMMVSLGWSRTMHEQARGRRQQPPWLERCCSPENWAASTGRQGGREKPAQGLWWPPGWVGDGIRCTQTPTPRPVLGH